MHQCRAAGSIASGLLRCWELLATTGFCGTLEPGQFHLCDLQRPPTVRSVLRLNASRHLAWRSCACKPVSSRCWADDATTTKGRVRHCSATNEWHRLRRPTGLHRSTGLPPDNASWGHGELLRYRVGHFQPSPHHRVRTWQRRAPASGNAARSEPKASAEQGCLEARAVFACGFSDDRP